MKKKKDTASGSDKINYSMIRNAGPRAHQEPLELINASNDAGKLPTSWKEAIIYPIPKPKEPGKVRPISLLSCLGKTPEKKGTRRTTMGGRPHAPTHLRLHPQCGDKRLPSAANGNHLQPQSHSNFYGTREGLRTSKWPGHPVIASSSRNSR